MTSTRWRATQRDQRPRHPPHARGAGYGEDGDTLGGHDPLCTSAPERRVTVAAQDRCPNGRMCKKRWCSQCGDTLLSEARKPLF
jgi:hypothetical protein